MPVKPTEARSRQQPSLPQMSGVNASVQHRARRGINQKKDMSMPTTLIIPGLYSSGPSHWQTWFEAQVPETIRVIQRDWKRADLPEWSGRVRHEITRHPGDIFLVAHSFGVFAGAQAAADYSERIRGALLVAPADPEKFGVADQIPAEPLGFPSIIIASTNDPWISIKRAAKLARAWGAEFVNLGPAGHINVEAGFRRLARRSCRIQSPEARQRRSSA